MILVTGATGFVGTRFCMVRCLLVAKIERACFGEFDDQRKE